MDTQRILALLPPVALILVIVALGFGEVHLSARDMLNVALGALISMVRDVYGFYFGSSLGDREKDVFPSQNEGQ